MDKTQTQPNAVQQPVVLDPQVVNLAKSIRQAESNGNFNAAGDYINGVPTSKGAYQFQDKTWKAWAGQYLGDSNAVMSDANQNAVAYSVISDWKKQGLNPAQIAAKWNSGHEVGWENMIGTNPDTKISYNVPAYVNKVMQNYQQFKAQTPLNNPLGVNTAEASNGQPAAQPDGITGNETPLQAAGNAIWNTPGSALNFGINALKSFSPISALQNIVNIPGAFSEALAAHNGDVWGTLIDTIKGAPNEAAKALVPEAIRQTVTGDLQGASQTAQRDPFGTAAPVVLATMGAAKFADTALGTKITPAMDAGISKAGQMVTKPVGAIAGKIADFTRSVTSHVLSLSEPSTITTILSDGKAVREMMRENDARGGVATEFGNAIDQIEKSKSATGSEYAGIAKSDAVVNIPATVIKKVFSDHGVDMVQSMDPAGNFIWKAEPLTAESALSKADVKHFEDLLNQYGSDRLSAKGFLNTRTAISDYANYDGKTSASTALARDLRGAYETLGDKQIPGLKELDERMAPQINQWKQIKKDFLTKDTQTGEWVLKPGATTKIAKAMGKGRGELLARMEEVMPGVTKRLEILSAVEDIQGAFKTKAGTYVRGLVEGGAVLTGNMAAVVGAIILNSAIAVPLLRGLGWSTGKIGTVVNILKSLADKSVSRPVVNAVAAEGATSENSSLQQQK